MIQRARQRNETKRLDKGRAAGFTLVEMLVVISVIIILLGILLVGLNHATKTAQTAHTKALMSSIRQALDQFKADVGYYPPVLGAEDPMDIADINETRALMTLPDRGHSSYLMNVQKWRSRTTLADYLIGYGSHIQDGYGIVPGASSTYDWDREQPPVGIRHPRWDGVWGASVSPWNGSLNGRMRLANGNYSPESDPASFDQGKVYGPYLELEDDKLLGSLYLDTTDGDKVKIAFPGEANYDADAPKVIVDYWGNPIYYHRRLYPEGALDRSYRPGIDYDGNTPPEIDERDLPTLSDVILLRPFWVPPGQGTNRLMAKDGADEPDPTTTFALETAEFALFSPGPDQTSDFEKSIESSRLPRRVDEEEYNRDNIVELGP